MSKLTYFPLLIDRWIAGTHWMTVEQVGAYIRLLVWLYDNPGQYLRDEAHIARILGCRQDRASRIWNDGIGDKLAIKSKFTRFNLGFYHSLVREIHKNGGKIRGLRGSSIGGGLPTEPEPEEDKNPPSSPPVKTETQKAKPNRTPKRAAFRPPDISEVRAYCEERKNGIDPEAWMAYYQANGWKCGRNPMKDWKAAVITWEKREREKRRRNNGYSGHANGDAELEALGMKLGIHPKPGEQTPAWHMRIRAAATRAH